MKALKLAVTVTLLFFLYGCGDKWMETTNGALNISRYSYYQGNIQISQSTLSSGNAKQCIKFTNLMDKKGLKGAIGQTFKDFVSAPYYAYMINASVIFHGDSNYTLNLYKSPKYFKLPTVNIPDVETLKRKLDFDLNEVDKKKWQAYIGKDLPVQDLANAFVQIHGKQNQNVQLDTWLADKFMDDKAEEFYNCFKDLLDIKEERLALKDKLISEEDLIKINVGIKKAASEMAKIKPFSF